MSTRSIAREAVSSFNLWATYADHTEVTHTRCLSDLIHAWVVGGKGVDACHGDFQTYLIGVIAIIEAWHEGRLEMNWEKPGDGEVLRQRPTQMFDHDEELEDDFDEVLDPHWFAHHTFRTLHPGLNHP